MRHAAAFLESLRDALRQAARKLQTLSLLSRTLIRKFAG